MFLLHVLNEAEDIIFWKDFMQIVGHLFWDQKILIIFAMDQCTLEFIYLKINLVT